MRICFAMLYHAAHSPSEHAERYLERMVLQRELPRALAARGHQVDVVHLYPRDQLFTVDSVCHHFVAPGRVAHTISAAAQASGREAALYQPALRAARRIKALKPDVIHFHGIILTWNLRLLQWVLGHSAPPIVLHYHGGSPPPNPLARRVLRDGLRRTARQLFSTRDHARPFVDAGLLADGANLVELIETSSDLQPIPRVEARRISGMDGDPVCLWAGRLHPIKDPLTALRAFAIIARERPGARFYLHYLTGELEPELRAMIATRPELSGRVELRGRVPFDQMRAIYSSADFLLQASLREIAGCAILEGMACGAIPAVTDISSFRVMTAGGRYGILFAPGDAEGMARGILAIPSQSIPAVSAAMRAHFEQELSFAAMAERLERVYTDVRHSS